MSNSTTYKIEKNDTLGQIAKDNNTTVENLANINGIDDPNKIYAGDTIKLSDNGASTKSSSNTGNKSTGSKNTDTSNKFTYDKFSYDDYAPSDTVVQAQNALSAAQAAKPGAYSSQWNAKVNEILGRIANREDFSYNVNEDALYQQYKDSYIQQGKMAMQDTMGQAAAMTGGYGNSYAAAVGNQAYQGYLQQLNDRVPELAQMAYDRYQQEGQDMLNLYSLYSDQENRDYGMYRDRMNDYINERDYQANRYDSERSFDYSKYADDRNFDYGVYADDRNLAYTDYRNNIADEQWLKQYDESVRQYNEQFEYGKERDSVADKQWQAQLDESARQHNENLAETKHQFSVTNRLKYMELKKAGEATGDNTQALEHVSSLSSADLVSTIKEYNADADNNGLASFLDDCVATGRLTEEQADNYYAKYNTSSDSITDTTVNPIVNPGVNKSGGKHWINNKYNLIN